jgi:2-dehydro-3-deoxygluconokinase
MRRGSRWFKQAPGCIFPASPRRSARAAGRWSCISPRSQRRRKPVSYDLNYRATLTNPADARAALEATAPHLHLLVLAERDAQNVLGFAQAGEDLATAIAARYAVPLIALTRPPDVEPGTLLLARGEFRYAPRLEVEVVDRIGAGDSFVAGLIHGLLDGNADLAIRLGGFAAAIGLATPGDINYLGIEDIARFHANRLGGLER